MPYPDDQRQPPLSPARHCGDAGGITVTAAGTGAPAGAVAWASVNTDVRTGVHLTHAGAAIVVASGARHTSPGARGVDPPTRLRRAWLGNGATRPGGKRVRRWA